MAQDLALNYAGLAIVNWRLQFNPLYFKINIYRAKSTKESPRDQKTKI